MPEMDGIETLHTMKTMPGNLCKNKPCVALTANAISGVKQMYLNEGFTDYLSKPVKPDKLEEIIIRYLPDELIKSEDEQKQSKQYQNQGVESENQNSPQNEGDLLDENSLEGIDVNTGLENCGTKKLLKKALLLFYHSIDEKFDELEAFLKAEDIKNYGIKIHALKSTARLIGAKELSK